MSKPIALTHAQKPLAGQVWQLHRTADGFDFCDDVGELITSIPVAEAGYRFRFPSFWASVSFLEVQTPDGSTYCFKPEKATVAAVRAQVDEALNEAPAAAARALRRKAWPTLGLGVLMFLGGGAATVYSYMGAAAKPGGGRYFVMTGLIGVGLFGTVRGLAWLARASQFDRASRGA